MLPQCFRHAKRSLRKRNCQLCFRECFRELPRASARGARSTFFISYVQILICPYIVKKKRRSSNSARSQLDGQKSFNASCLLSCGPCALEIGSMEVPGHLKSAQQLTPAQPFSCLSCLTLWALALDLQKWCIAVIFQLPISCVVASPLKKL